MPTYDQWMAATGLYTTDSDAESAVQAHFDSAKTLFVGDSKDFRFLTDGQPRYKMVSVVPLAALRLGDADILSACSRAGIEVSDRIDEPGVKAYVADKMASGSFRAIRAAAGPRYPYEDAALAFDEILTEIAGDNDWQNLRVTPYAKNRTQDPRRWRWDNKENLAGIRLNRTYSEGPVDPADPQGPWSLTIAYNADSTLYAETIRVYQPGPVGPSSHLDTHRLYREDGTYLEWSDPGPREYSGSDSSKIGRDRRTRAVDALIGGLESGVSSAGGDTVAMLTRLHTPILDPTDRMNDRPSPLEQFVSIGNPGPLIAAVATVAATLDSATETALNAQVQAALAPWIPT